MRTWKINQSIGRLIPAILKEDYREKISYRFYMRHHYVAVLGSSDIHRFRFMVISGGTIMYRHYTIYWEVDGCTGNTIVRANCIEEVKQYFELKFAKFGYILRGIE